MELFVEALLFSPASVALPEFLFFLLEGFLLDLLVLLEEEEAVWDLDFFAAAERPVALPPLAFLTCHLAFFGVCYFGLQGLELALVGGERLVFV